MAADWRNDYAYYVAGRGDPETILALARASILYLGHTAVINLGGPGSLVPELGKRRLGPEEFGYALCFDEPEDEAAIREKAAALMQQQVKERLRAALAENLFAE